MRIYLSHSAADNREAVALRQWLVEQQPAMHDEIFLDLDRFSGLQPGTRWQESLRRASTRADVLLALLSRAYESSAQCMTEFRIAESTNKKILCARLESDAGFAFAAAWQAVDLFGHGLTSAIDIGDGGAPIVFATDALRRLLDVVQPAALGPNSFVWPPKDDPGRSPYRGWEPLQERDAAVYFGRETELARALEELRGMRVGYARRIFVILGASGSGKSSFLRAGLIPRLRQDDKSFVVLDAIAPQRDVLTGDAGLAVAIASTRRRLGLNEPSPGEIRSLCRDDLPQIRSLLAEIRDVAGSLSHYADTVPTAAPTLILPVDQAGELLGPDAAREAASFWQLLAELAGELGDDTTPVITVLTIDTADIESLQSIPELAEVGTALFEGLKPMRPDQLKEVIVGPAGRASDAGDRLDLEPALVERLLSECRGNANALPLLSLTLARLFEGYGSDGDLTLRDYDRMGGARRLVENEIDRLLARDPAMRRRQLGQLREAFIPWLATINPGTDQPVRRVARWADLPPASKPLLDDFVRNRLLVRDIRDGDDVVEVAMESLFWQWPDLAEWLTEQRTDLRNADSLERSVADWEANHRDSAWLLSGTRLVEVEKLTATVGFSDRIAPARDFIEASRRAEDLRADAARRTLVTTAARLVSEAREMLADRRPGGDLRAFLQLLAAYRLAPSRGGADLRAGLAARPHLRMILPTSAEVRCLAAGPSWEAIAAGCDDAQIRIWNDNRNGEPVAGHTDSVLGLTFSPDGSRIASCGHDRTIRLWDAMRGEPVGEPLLGHTDAVCAVAYRPDGRLLVTGGADMTVRLWDGQTGRPVGVPLSGHTDCVHAVAFSQDGRRVASGGADGAVRIWDESSGGWTSGEPLAGHADSVRSVSFTGDGGQIVSAGLDGTIRFWDVSTGQQIGAPLRGDGTGILSAAANPGARYVVSGHLDGTVRRWAVEDGTQDVMTGHHERVWCVACGPDSAAIVSGGGDATIRVWQIVGDDDETPAAESPVDAVCTLVSSNMSRTDWQQWVSPEIEFIELSPELPTPPD